MQIIERGHGESLVITPGLQGRWEYVGPAVDALAQSFRVITFPLCDEPASGLEFEPSRPFDAYTGQVLAALNRLDLVRATICGISFGGLIALRFAAAHPDRTSALILASTPGPSWRLGARHQIYARLGWVAGPLFLAEAPWRLRAEVSAALGRGEPRRRFVRAQLKLLLKAPLSLTRMAARARLIASADLAASARRVTAPTLVITGEQALDRVVPAHGSAEYVRLIPHARGAVLERTGHLGSITRPDLFAEVVRDFVATAERAGKNDAA